MLKNAAAIGTSPQGTGASQSSVSTYRKSDDPNPYVNVGRNGQSPAITPKATYTPIPNRAGSRLLFDHTCVNVFHMLK